MPTPLNLNLILTAVIMLFLILWLLSRLNGKQDRFFFWTTFLFFIALALAAAGYLYLRKTSAGPLNLLPIHTVPLFQGFLLIAWVLVGVLFANAFNPKMNHFLRLVLGFALSFPVTMIAGNYIYELIVF